MANPRSGAIALALYDRFRPMWRRLLARHRPLMLQGTILIIDTNLSMLNQAPVLHRCAECRYT